MVTKTWCSWAGGVVTILAAAALILAVWRWRSGSGKPEPAHPSAADSSPDTMYVGDAVCARCHESQMASYKQHPMGRSCCPVSSLVEQEHYDQAAHNPFEVAGLRFLVERQGNQEIHKEIHRDARGKVVCELAAEVQIVIGSGTHGRSYLINKDGYLFQSPISWYSGERIWDLSPHLLGTPSHFYRPVDVQCLFCHCNGVDQAPNAVNRYRLPVFRGYAIGCERCHGPGEQHVQRHEQGAETGDGGDPIVNPGRLAPALREAVCQQCHLQGVIRIVRRGRQPFDYRPGRPLQEVFTTFVKSPEFADSLKAVNHVEQMYVSRCFRESAGRLGCISCHDPHKLPAPAQKTAYYRQRCLSCHQETSCGLPLKQRHEMNAADSCIACHMPPSEVANVAHTARTDHRILRQAGGAVRLPSHTQILLPGVQLVNFFQDEGDPGKEEVYRDLGLALYQQAENHPPDQLKLQLGQLALPLLETAVRHVPEDVAALEAEGYALGLQGRKEEALAAFVKALTHAPERETSLVYAATVCADLGEPEEAIAYWHRVLAVDPWSWQYHYRLARLLAERQEWPQALEECRHALDLNPASVDARLVLVKHALEGGDAEGARREFDTILALKPPNADRLRRWFEEQSR